MIYVPKSDLLYLSHLLTRVSALTHNTDVYVHSRCAESRQNQVCLTGGVKVTELRHAYELNRMVRLPVASLQDKADASQASTDLLPLATCCVPHYHKGESVPPVNPNNTYPLVSESTPESLKKAYPRHVYPKSLVRYTTTPRIITSRPAEFIGRDGRTYRVLTSQDDRNERLIQWLASNEDPEYDALDAGHVFVTYTLFDNIPTYPNGPIDTTFLGERRIHVYPRYTPDCAKYTALLRCCSNTEVVNAEIRANVVIRPDTVQLLTLKFFRKIQAAGKEGKVWANVALEKYEKFCASLEKDLEEDGHLANTYKLADGRINSMVMRDITFTPDKMTYQSLSVELPGLYKSYVRHTDFMSDFDIYTITQQLVTKLDEAAQQVLTTERANRKLIEPVASPTDTTVEEGPDAKPKEVKEQEGDQTVTLLDGLVINGMPITLTAKVKSGARYLNGVKIHKQELTQVLYRAICHDDAEHYKAFLKQVSKLCLRWHDVLANGLPVKIHSDMTQDEYRNPQAGERAPRLRFFRDRESSRIFLKLNDELKVPVNFHKLLTKARILNRKTDDYQTGGNDMLRPSDEENATVFQGRSIMSGDLYSKRDHNWAKLFLTRALVESTKDKDGTQHLTLPQVEQVLGIAVSSQLAVLQRSYALLERTIEKAGAQECTYKDQPAYKVQGNSGRNYIVIKRDAKVYNADTGAYICIVNSGQYKGAGFDDVAARLLALKNDSVMQNIITTLKHQPAN